MIQYNTKNKSFQKLHMILKELGVKNNDFFLRLNNPKLINIDPTDEDNLTFEQKVMVLHEVQTNIWYFLREVIRIPTGGDNIYFEATRLSISIVWSVLMNVNVIVEGPRQCYKTSTYCFVYLWILYFGAVNTKSLVFGMKEDQVKDIMTRVKDVRNILPKYLQIKTKRDIDNVSTIRHVMSDGKYNQLQYKVTGANPRDATRGLSASILWFDESAFITDIDLVYETAIYSFSTVSEVAKRNNSPYHMALSTTAGYLDTKEGKWMYSLIQKSAKFSDKIYDLCVVNEETGEYDFSEQLVAQYLDNNRSRGKGGSPFMHIRFNYWEIGKPDNYLEKQRFLSTDEDSFRREVLMEWRDTKSNHPYGADRISELQNNQRKPTETIIIHDLYFLSLYVKKSELDPEIPYVMGLDIGSNTGSDFSALVIIDPRNGEVVGVMRANHHTLPIFQKAIEYILFDLLPNSILIPENNGIGTAVAQMFASILPKHRLFHTNDKPGLTNSKPIRDLFFNEILRTCLIDNMNKIHDMNIISEIVTLVYKNGRIDHDVGCHDDTLMAYLIPQWFLKYYNGIDKSTYIDPIIIGCENYKKLTDKERYELFNMKHLDKIVEETSLTDNDILHALKRGKYDTQRDVVMRQDKLLERLLYEEDEKNQNHTGLNLLDTHVHELHDLTVREVDDDNYLLTEEPDKYNNEDIYKQYPEEILKQMKKDKEYNKIVEKRKHDESVFSKLYETSTYDNNGDIREDEGIHQQGFKVSFNNYDPFKVV